MKTLIDIINRCEPYICLIILIYILLSIAYDLYLLKIAQNFSIRASKVEERIEEISKSRMETLIGLKAQNGLNPEDVQNINNLNYQFK